MKTYISPQKGKTKKKFKDPKALKRPLQPFFLSCSDLCPQIKGHPGVFIVDAVKKAGRDAVQHGRGWRAALWRGDC